MLLNVLEQTRRSEPDTALQRSLVILTTELDNLKIALLVLLFEPGVGLVLRIYDQWPTMTVGDDDRVVG